MRNPIRFVAPGLLILLIVCFFWRLVLTNQFTWLTGPDTTSQIMPWFQFQASEWHAGRFPLWDPSGFAGQPLLAQVQPGTAYPLNWLVFLAPLKHGWIRQSVLHWYFVLIRVFAALAFFWFCRDMGRTRMAAFFGAAVYGTAGFVGSIEWPQMVNGVVWVPLVFLFQFRVMGSRAGTTLRNAILSGFFLGLTWLCGHHQLPLFVTLASATLWIYSSFRRPANGRFAAAAVAVAVLVSGLQTVPAFEYGRQSVRWASADHALAWNEPVPYPVHEAYSFKPLALIGFVVPGFDLHVNPLIGGIPFALAVAGLAAAWRADRRVRWFAALALGSILFALGPNSWIHGVLYSVVPLVDKARAPSHALILFHLAVCALAAWGIDRFPASSRRFAKATSIALGTFGTSLLLVGFVLFMTRLVQLDGDTRFAVSGFTALLASLLLWTAWARAIPSRTAAVCLLLLALVDLGNTFGSMYAGYNMKERTATLRRMAQDADLIEYMRARTPEPFRLDYDRAVLPHNIGLWWGVDTISAYVSGVPERVMRNDPYSARVQQMLGTRYYIGNKPLRPDQREMFTGASGLKVFLNPDASPRAWTVHDTVLVPAADTRKYLVDNQFDLWRRALVTEPVPALESCSGDTVRMTSHNPNRVVLNATMRCTGLLILSETWFPGWRANVDGEQAAIHPVNGFIRGVRVPGGNHTVEMVYRPGSVIAGFAMTVAGALVAMAAAAVRPKNHLQPEPDINYS